MQKKKKKIATADFMGILAHTGVASPLICMQGGLKEGEDGSKGEEEEEVEKKKTQQLRGKGNSGWQMCDVKKAGETLRHADVFNGEALRKQQGWYRSPQGPLADTVSAPVWVCKV